MTVITGRAGLEEHRSVIAEGIEAERRMGGAVVWLHEEDRWILLSEYEATMRQRLEKS